MIEEIKYLLKETNGCLTQTQIDRIFYLISMYDLYRNTHRLFGNYHIVKMYGPHSSALGNIKKDRLKPDNTYLAEDPHGRGLEYEFHVSEDYDSPLTEKKKKTIKHALKFYSNYDNLSKWCKNTKGYEQTELGETIWLDQIYNTDKEIKEELTKLLDDTDANTFNTIFKI